MSSVKPVDKKIPTLRVGMCGNGGVVGDARLLLQFHYFAAGRPYVAVKLVLAIVFIPIT